MSKGRMFISYAEENAHVVHAIAERLRSEAELDVWYYQEQPGGVEFVTHLMQVIEQASAVILMLSQISANSTFVLNEILYAREHHRRIIPVYLEACDGPVALLVNNLHRIEAGFNHDIVPQILRALDLPLVAGTPFPVAALTVLQPYREWASLKTGCHLIIPDHITPIELPTELGWWTIGRLPGNHLEINLEFVTRRSHAYIRARIEATNVAFVLYDESTYGTYINGERINGSQILHEDDEIGLGKSDAMVRFTFSKTELALTTMHG